MRKSVSAAAVCFTLFCGLPSMSHAQFWARILNPRVTVDMRHPPAFGLDLETVVFGPVSGECADEIIQSLIASLLADEINVVNRQEADLILGEHQLSESGWVLPESAAAVGELLGPSVLIAVNVGRCATEQQPSYRDHVRKRKDPDTAEEYEVLEREFFSRTSAFVNVSVQVVDMATGRIVGVIRSNHSPELVNSSREGQPEFPGAYAVLDMAYSQVYEDVSRRLLGWTERRELVFYDDDECGLKQAHRALESARFDRALELSLANLDACQATAGVKTNKLARAYYNVGMSHAVVGQNQAALGYLRRAAELDDGGIARDAIASAETAVRLQEELRQYEESTAAEAVQRSADLETRAEATEANTLSNGDVVVLVELGLSEAIVVKKIQTSACRFDTSADGLVALTNAGVPEPIILAMMDARCGGGLTACGKTHAAFDGRCIPSEPPRFAGLRVAFRSKYTRYSSLTRLVSRAPRPSRRSREFHHRLLGRALPQRCAGFARLRRAMPAGGERSQASARSRCPGGTRRAGLHSRC